MDYRTYIVTPGGHEDPLAETAMLSVTRTGLGGREVLRMTDKGWLWERVTEAVGIKPTVELPGEALASVIDAVHRLHGYKPGSEEVLREWLKSEQSLRDNLLTSILPPRIIDMGGMPMAQMPTGDALRASTGLGRKP